MTSVVGAGVIAGMGSWFWLGVFAVSPSGVGAPAGRSASTYRVLAICTHTYGPTFCPHWPATQTPPNFGGAAANDTDTEQVSTTAVETMPATVLIRVCRMGQSTLKVFGDSEIANLPRYPQKGLGNVRALRSAGFAAEDFGGTRCASKRCRALHRSVEMLVTTGSCPLTRVLVCPILTTCDEGGEDETRGEVTADRAPAWLHR